MTTSRISRARLAVTAVLSIVLLAAVTALAALAAPPPGKGKNKGAVAAAQYQYAPAGNQYGKRKVAICHKGKTKMVPLPAVNGHRRHGDTLGPC
jgi:hypothetical protein